MSQRECVKCRAVRLCRGKTQSDGAAPASAASLSLSLPAASRSDTGVRLSSPGEVEKIVEGAEGWGCVWIRTEYGCKHVLFLKE